MGFTPSTVCTRVVIRSRRWPSVVSLCQDDSGAENPYPVEEVILTRGCDETLGCRGTNNRTKPEVQFTTWRNADRERASSMHELRRYHQRARQNDYNKSLVKQTKIISTKKQTNVTTAPTQRDPVNYIDGWRKTTLDET